jgi:hypothetical protein
MDVHVNLTKFTKGHSYQPYHVVYTFSGNYSEVLSSWFFRYHDALDSVANLTLLALSEEIYNPSR